MSAQKSSSRKAHTQLTSRHSVSEQRTRAPTVVSAKIDARPDDWIEPEYGEPGSVV